MLVPYNPGPFELPVSDRVVDKTIVKQKVHFVRLEHEDAARTCIIHILVAPYALAEDGGYGPALTKPPFSAYPDTLRADNNTLVSMEDGAILAVRYAPKPDGTLSTDTEWEQAVEQLAAQEQPVMYQGDYFLYVRDNYQVIIGDLIRHHIMQANAMRKFAQ